MIALCSLAFIACVARHVWLSQSGGAPWHWGKMSGLCAAVMQLSFVAGAVTHWPILTFPYTTVIQDLSLSEREGLITALVTTPFGFLGGWLMAHLANFQVSVVRFFFRRR